MNDVHEGVFVECIGRRVPTKLPIPDDTIESLQLDHGTVLVVTHDYLARHGKKLNELAVHPLIKQLKYIGGEKEFEPGVDFSAVGIGLLAIQSLEFCGVENVRHIPDNFLMLAQSLKAIDLAPFRSVTALGQCFMRGCCALTSIDLSPLSTVTTVGDYFMSNCVSLTSVDLGAFQNVTSVGDSFMAHCTSLTSIDLTSFANVTSIGVKFMFECTHLANVDPSPLVSVSAVDIKTFMAKTKGLTPAKRKKLLREVEDRRKCSAVVAAPYETRERI